MFVEFKGGLLGAWTLYLILWLGGEFYFIVYLLSQFFVINIMLQIVSLAENLFIPFITTTKPCLFH
jgi:hypothetical protein